MPYELPEWAAARLRGVTVAEVFQVLRARRKWARPSTGSDLRVTLIAGRTDAGRPILVAVHQDAPFHSVIIAAGELTGDNLDAFTRWEAETDEPFEG
ncbi:hypothetical protein [Nocardia terpenica]|uniref:Uncharacterized protein n=1 Tax=Nocardia terpenica TaxID=455432 RepID=A0A291RYU2_9NOCA|nr:hypothetical protein [Nocardia terpenica]ATL72487.1 hypothetical protein CRH09_39625 [Nocardia terpenica]